MRNRIKLVLAFGSLAVWLPAAALADEPSTAGKLMYGRYCSACHGPGGKGDGAVSQFMRPKPADLTQLAKKAGGTYPFHEVMRIIDGRATVRAHGDPDMPVWGTLFAEEEGNTLQRNTVARGKVVMITEYVGWLQEK